MPERFATFEVRASSPTRLVGKVVDQLGKRGRAELGLGLVALTSDAKDAAEPLARTLAQVGGSWVVTTSNGVLSQRGEVEGTIAAVGLTLPGAIASVAAHGADPRGFAHELETRLRQGQSALVLTPADDQKASWLGALDAFALGRDARLFGAGLPPEYAHFHAHDGLAERLASLAVAFAARWQPQVASSAGCRLLSPLLPVTRTRGRTLLELEGRPALTVLSQSATELEDAPLILVATATGDDPLSADGRRLALSAIVGVDPGRGGIDLSTELPISARVAFAVRDPHAARTDLDAHLRTLRQNCRGTAPAFGIYVNGSGRGRQLYDSADVDVRLIRSHFPELPLFGFQSVFELTSAGGRVWPQVHSGVLAVFGAPS